MPTKYPVLVEGEDGWTEWIKPVMRGWRMSCCDCDLIHSVEFKVKGGRVYARFSRDDRATAAKRAHRRKREARRACEAS